LGMVFCIAAYRHGLIIASNWRRQLCWREIARVYGNSTPAQVILIFSNSWRQFMHVLWWIVVGLIAGWATGKIMRGSGYGAFMDILVGIVGALIGGWIMRALGFAGQGGMIYTILVAIAGGVILTWVVRLV